ncbi:MAG: zinc ABC transporter substrate-binding protein [Treponema sp.]|nr:zinc ABC transporter substrate-binding protein [Treponema sp.]
MKTTKFIAGAAILIAVTVSSLFARKTPSEKDGKIKIVTTIFPEYDWTREILGDKIGTVDLTLLLNNGVDLHSYSPSVKDIAKISECDIFIYGGGESDEWVEDVLGKAKNKNLRTINLLEVLGDKAKTEEIVEGMQIDDDDRDDDEIEYDEHVWLSLKNAQIFCTEIAGALCEKDAQNKAAYKANLDAYLKKLSVLDGQYAQAVKSARTKTLLFGDRFPFRYLVDDYGIRYYAAFLGCSAESEASFKTVVFLAEKLDELGLKNVCQIETGNGKIARTIIASSKSKNAAVLTLDSMQSTTAGKIKKGASYLGTMENNLSVLKTALD